MTSIFVAKLDFNTTEDELRSLFEEHGKVNRVTIAKDRETGKPRGFAFVEMYNDAEADAAIEALDNSSVNGRTIAVKKADDRSNSKPAGGATGPRPERPARTENTGPRPDFKSSEERIPFKKPEDVAPRPSFGEDLPSKTDRTKSKTAFSAKKSDQPKQHKMEAYRKSGKANRFLEEDDDDWDLHLNTRRTDGWDEEE